MKGFFATIKFFSNYMYYVSAVALAFIMLLTVSDVVSRLFYRPIIGVYDLTVLMGGIVIGFAIPFSTWKKVHVHMTFLTDMVSPVWRKVLMSITHCLAIFLFLVFGCNLILYGVKLYETGEVSQTIHLPFYPAVLGIGVACLINCIVLLDRLIVIFRQEEKA